MSDAIARLRLARAEGVGPVTYRRLLRRYPDPNEAIAALPALAEAGGRASAPRIPSTAEAEREIERVEQTGARLLFLDTPPYPALLALLEDPPPVLACHGRTEALDTRAVAVVGSRNASANGRRMAEALGAGLARQGVAVVSGLARGIDAAAHRGALAAGVTIACIAGGLDRPYPPEHAGLQQEIAERGVVLAEMPLGTVPQARHFPRRNRIIAGLALGVVVVEAAPRSGSLITARLALEAGRELFAVPGSPLDARSQGANNLLRQGAHVTETPEDVLANLPDHPFRQGLARDPLFLAARPRLGLAEPCETVAMTDAPAVALDDRTRREIAGLLGPAPTSVDDLLRRCQFSPSTIMSALLELELAGRVETLSGNRVALVGAPAD